MFFSQSIGKNNYYLNFGLQLYLKKIRVIKKWIRIRFLFLIWNAIVSWSFRCLKIFSQRFLNRKKIQFKKTFGVTWDYFLNNISLAIFIQLFIKLLLSMFSIKVNVFIHFLLLSFILLLCLKFSLTYIFKTFLLKCCKKFINPLYYDLDISDEVFVDFDIDLMEMVGYNKSLKYIYFFSEKIINFFVFFRLCFYCEPFLFNFVKFLILYFFLYDYNLTLAYLLSFIFILSRFIFFLSDENYTKLKEPFLYFPKALKINSLKNAISPTKNNVKLISVWILKSLIYQYLSEPYQNKNMLYRIYPNYYNLLVTMAERNKFILNLQLQQPHYYTKIFVLNSFFFISLFYFSDIAIYTCSSLLLNAKKKTIIDFPKIQSADPFTKKILKSVEGHAALCQKTDGVFAFNTLTTIKQGDTSCLMGVLKKPLTIPHKPNQGVSTNKYITKQVFIPENKITNKHFSGNNEALTIEVQKVVSEEDPVIIDIDYLPYVTQETRAFYETLNTQRCIVSQVPPLPIQHCLHSPVNSSYSNSQKEQALNFVVRYMNTLPPFEKEQFKMLMKTLTVCKNNIHSQLDISTNSNFENVYEKTGLYLDKIEHLATPKIQVPKQYENLYKKANSESDFPD